MNDKIFNESFNYLLKEASVDSITSGSINDKIVTKLFKAVNNKALNSDYTMIEKTKGDFVKISNYSDLFNAEKFLAKLSQEISNKEIVEAISVLQKTRNNLIDTKKIFTKAFLEGNRLFILTYDSVSISYIMGMSLIIAEAIEMFKDEYNVYKIGIKADAKLDSSLNYISTLKNFDSLVKSGELLRMSKELNDKENIDKISLKEDSFLAELMSSKKDSIIYKLVKKVGTPILDFLKKASHNKIARGIVLIIGLFVAIRGGIYVYFNCRIRLSNYFKNISILAQASASQANDPQTKKKQEKAAETLEKISDKLRIDSKVASDKAKNEEIKDEKEIIEDVAKEQKEENKNNSNNSSDDGDFF